MNHLAAVAAPQTFHPETDITACTWQVVGLYDSPQEAETAAQSYIAAMPSDAAKEAGYLIADTTTENHPPLVQKLIARAKAEQQGAQA